jgi:hypothetical protein
MNSNPYSFISVDIIVWNKAICQYGSVSHLIEDCDDVQMANEEEIKSYKTANL